MSAVARITPAVRRVRKLVAIARKPTWRKALRHGVAASVEHSSTPLAAFYATVLDVGANRGQFALVARERFPTAEIICFEPLPVALKTLTDVLSDDPKSRIVPVAASGAKGTATMNVTRADDSSSLRRPTSRQMEAFPGTDAVEVLQVQTERLDDLVDVASLAGPVLLKIDVQGAELEVLAGAEGVLGAVDTILVECSFVELYEGQALADQVIEHLRGRGFRLADIAAPTSVAGKVLQADLVFERTVA